MSEDEILADRDLTEFLIDPNFSGAFVGGPPLLTATEAKRMIEQPEEVERQAIEALKKIWPNEETAGES